MTVEVRAARSEEMDDLRHLLDYVFAEFEEHPQLVQPEWTTCAFVDGRLASSFAAFPFRVRWNGARADAAGVTAVGTLPSHRRRGLLRRTMTRAFAEQRERGQSLAILWASFGAIYQRFGYAPGTDVVSYDLDPRWAALHPWVESPGTVTMVERDEALPTLREVYRSWSTGGTLLLHRPEATWQFGVLRKQEAKRPSQVAVHRDPSGAATGYVVYQLARSSPPTPDQTLTVTDFVALDAAAHAGLWRFLLAHDLVARIHVEAMPPDDPTPLLVQEPRRLGRRVSDGLYLRLVDVERALALRPYAASDRLVVEVRGDEPCPWNQGGYAIEADHGGARVRRSTETPHLSLPPRSLASLACGYASASALSRSGLLDARDDAVLRRADRLFATERPPFCRDGF